MALQSLPLYRGIWHGVIQQGARIQSNEDDKIHVRVTVALMRQKQTTGRRSRKPSQKKKKLALSFKDVHKLAKRTNIRDGDAREGKHSK